MNHFGLKIDENNIDCIDLSHCQGVATSDTCHMYTWCKYEIIKHCIPSLPFSVYYINISFCHAPSFPDPQPLVQEIGRVCNKRLREAWE